MKLLAIRPSPQASKSLVMSKAAVPFMFRQAQLERHLYFGEFNEHTPLRPAAPELQILPDLAPPFSGMAQGRSHVYHRPHRRPDDLSARAGLRPRQPVAADGRHFLHGVPRRRNDLLQHDEQRQFRIAVFRFRAHARAAHLGGDHEHAGDAGRHRAVGNFMGSKQKSDVRHGSTRGGRAARADTFAVVAVADPAGVAGRSVLRRARPDHDRAGTRLRFFHVLLHAGDHTHDVIMRRVFSSRAIAAAVAERLGCTAADACDRHRTAIDERRGAAKFGAACRGVAGLCVVRILCVAGVVPAQVVEISVALGGMSITSFGCYKSTTTLLFQ
jgi:hypothetical protein